MWSLPSVTQIGRDGNICKQGIINMSPAIKDGVKILRKWRKKSLNGLDRFKVKFDGLALRGSGLKKKCVGSFAYLQIGCKFNNSSTLCKMQKSDI